MAAPDFLLRDLPGRGLGVFTRRPFAAGDTVMVGVIEAELTVNDRHASQIGEHRFIRHAGLVSLVNHSCAPNCGIRVNATGAHDYVAMRNIVAGEEILFDYAMRNYHLEHFPARCLCGASGCRGQVTGWVGLSAAQKAHYRPWAAPYLFALDEKADAPPGGGR